MCVIKKPRTRGGYSPARGLQNTVAPVEKKVGINNYCNGISLQVASVMLLDFPPSSPSSCWELSHLAISSEITTLPRDAFPLLAKHRAQPTLARICLVKMTLTAQTNPPPSFRLMKRHILWHTCHTPFQVELFLTFCSSFLCQWDPLVSPLVITRIAMLSPRQEVRGSILPTSPSSYLSSALHCTFSNFPPFVYCLCLH